MAPVIPYFLTNSPTATVPSERSMGPRGEMRSVTYRRLGPDYVGDEEALDVRIGNVVEANFSRFVLERHLVFDLHDIGSPRLLLQIVRNQRAGRSDVFFKIGLVRSLERSPSRLRPHKFACRRYGPCGDG